MSSEYEKLCSEPPSRVPDIQASRTKSFTIKLPELSCSGSNAGSPSKSLRLKWTQHKVNLIFHSLLFIYTSITGIRMTEAGAQMRPNGLSTNDRVNNGIFMQLPFSNPPTVRPPPYSESDEPCPEVNERENWVDTLCGDLNKGYVPENPLGHKFPDGASYPFETIKNKTLQFFRHALPVLKKDKSLPKVARFNPYQYQPNSHYRSKRSLTSFRGEDLGEAEPAWPRNDSALEPIEGRSNSGWRRQHQYFGPQKMSIAQSRLCDKSSPTGSLLCKLYNAMWGKSPHNYHRTQDPNSKEQGQTHQYAHLYARPQEEEEVMVQDAESKNGVSSESAPPTPCPSSADYLTPVFARNHEGAWRYVVQIPREGYFTQTVEVTKCSETNCFYMEGSCRTSPRWQSLLVAEMFYPDAAFPKGPVKAKPDTAPPRDLSEYQQYLQKRAAGGLNELSVPAIPPQCDGLDEIGCFQVRLFYDWFLIPGSCKCWKRQFDFTRVHQSR